MAPPALSTGTLPAGWMCAVVKAQMPCRVCGLTMPVNHLPSDGTLRCLSCGRAQAADEHTIDSLVRTAHAVADLAGEVGPYEHVGGANPTTEETVGDGRLVVGPGRPQCGLCDGPLEVTAQQDKRAAIGTQCLGCGDEATYAVHPEQRWHAFVGAIAPEHRRDQAPVKRSTEGAVLAVCCPKCGGPLDPKLDRHIVVCTYCETKSVIVEETWTLLQGPARQESWWLLFEGPSRERKDIERQLERRRRAEDAALGKRRKTEAKRRQRQAPPPVVRKLPWFERNYSMIAGFSTIGAGFVTMGAISLGVHWATAVEEPTAVGFVCGFAVMLVGIVFQGKGKIGDMPRARATRVFQVSIISVIVAFAVLLALVAWAPHR